MTTVTRTTRLIHSDSGTYPLYLSDLTTYAPNTVFGPTVDTETLIEFGFEVVHEVPAVVGDVVIEGKPELKDGEWYQTWIGRSFSEAEAVSKLQAKKEELQAGAEALRVALFAKGFAYRFPDNTVYHVQVRSSDRGNISDLRTIAKEVILEGQEMDFDFRVFENVSVTLTAQQMVDMANMTFTQVQGGYKAIWAYKEAIDAATTLEELPAAPDDIFIPITPGQ